MGDKLLIEDLSFSLPPGGIVGVIGPNGAGKSTLFRMLTGQEQPDAGTIESATRCSWPMSTSPATRSTPTRRSGRISGGADIIELGDAEMNSRAYCSPSTSRAATSRRRSACSRAASATASTWPSC
jgi:ATPase subunit of ABC transporter with duplicated ATPase domains